MNKKDLTTPRLPEADVETVAGTIRVRGLSRSEVLGLQKTTDDADALDARMLELGVVDPKLDASDIQRWRKAWTVSDLEPVIDRIAELSGMKDAEEAVEASFRPRRK